MDRYTLGQPAAEIDSLITWFERVGELEISRSGQWWNVTFRGGSAPLGLLLEATVGGEKLLQALDQLHVRVKEPLQRILWQQKAHDENNDDESYIHRY